MSEKDYPPLPEPRYRAANYTGCPIESTPYFGANQMRAYVDADRAQRAQHETLIEALRRIKLKAVSLADAQVIALEALSATPTQPEAGEWERTWADLPDALKAHPGIKALRRAAQPPAAQPVEPTLPERDKSKPAEQQGLFHKFDVRRTDGSDATGGKHHGCEYFVLDVRHDAHAKAALTAYAACVRATHPLLADNMIERYGLAAALPLEQGQAALREALEELIEFAELNGGYKSMIDDAKAALATPAQAPQPSLTETEPEAQPSVKPADIPPAMSMAASESSSSLQYRQGWNECRDYVLRRALKRAQPDADLTAGFERGKDAAKADALDAARYRWLANDCDGNAQDDFTMYLRQHVMSRAEFDRAIDAAMAQTAEPKA